ncbi:hypothetical protein [Desulforhopalus singaporensis]|uniref:Uncharacterized protein n=1 Tax=Desulforhopalus singaporensis TaxID=91360 RepID=A0A1H0VFT3_9BACT|nr:hypothetical protein [Desulforhopalus singaporensis]SDP77193.1 hypothetical protein SAMN05660330_04042 [Desulforhopalus singaporensis]
MALNIPSITALPDPPSKADPANFAERADAFLDALADFCTELNASVAELNTITSGLDQQTAIVAWDNATTYDFPDVVAGSDGYSYRCIDTGVLNVDPTTDDGTYWLKISNVIPTGGVKGQVLIKPSNSDFDTEWADFHHKNLLINALGRINQEDVSGTVILSAGEYGHDGWKAGSGGCTYTFSTTGNTTTFTITSGTLLQIIEDKNVPGGAVVLSWIGTAQARINSGSYGDSGEVTATLTEGTQAQVEFGVGTFSTPQLELGTVPTNFEYVDYQTDFVKCERYLRLIYWKGMMLSGRSTNSSVLGSIPLNPPMRATPTVLKDQSSGWQVLQSGYSYSPSSSPTFTTTATTKELLQVNSNGVYTTLPDQSMALSGNSVNHLILDARL